MSEVTIASRVGWTLRPGRTEGPRVYAAPLPRGPIAVLDGPAAVVWLAIVEDRPGPLAERVAEAVGEPVEVVAADVAAFVDELVERGLVRTV